MKLRGIEKVMRNLDRVAGVAHDRVQSRIVLDAAQIVVERAKQLVPVDSGLLRDSIGTSLSRPAEMSFSIKGDGVRVFIGPASDIDYAPYVEFGTYFRAARPFMRPAMDESSEAVQHALARGIWSFVVSQVR